MDIVAVFKRDNPLVWYTPLVIVIQAKSGKYDPNEESVFINSCNNLRMMGLFLTPSNYIDTLEKIVKQVLI